ncbi:MAG: sensor histidine kinase, partial [Loktanella sp.]|nr:sensor histidine kinase [Loktanella sp.]
GFDISDRKRSEEQLAFVMREVNHRSKNMLAVVQSILRQMHADTTEQFVQDFSARLRALSACQDLLVNASNDSPDIHELLQTQLTHFAILDGNRVQLSGPTLAITSESAQNLGMAIYELATNASKYGALSNEQGRIAIHWKVENDLFHLDWRETGGPQVAKPSSRGFGTVVLEDMLAMALSASTTIAFDPAGLHWSLGCPLAAVTPRQAG